MELDRKAAADAAVWPTAAVATAQSDESKLKHVDHVKSTEALVVDDEVARSDESKFKDVDHVSSTEAPVVDAEVARSDESKLKDVDHMVSTETPVVDPDVTAAPAPVVQIADEDVICAAPPACAAESTDKVTVLNNSSNTEVPGELKAPDSSSNETPVQGIKTVVTTPEAISAEALVGDTGVAAPRGMVAQTADVPESKVCKLGRDHDK